MFTLILPVYNEAANLKKCITEIRRRLKNTDYEIIVAEDGSTDGSDKISDEFSRKFRNVRCLHSDKRLGRGVAIKNASKIAKGEYVGYIDVDMATHPKHIMELVNLAEKYDVVTGSRYLKESIAKRALKRHILSMAYNFFVRLLLKSKLHDHQCGFKIFKKAVLKNLNAGIKDNHWFWDTEIMVVAQRSGYSVKEFPITWREGKNSKVSILKDTKNMGIKLFRMWVSQF
jgi:glycosyltransferase involved in cell wall biosynthesis